jgi:hypothetical protein
MIAKLNVTKIITANANLTWSAISSIGGLERWFPMITGCSVSGTGEGATRILTLADGAKIKDRIEAIDHQLRRLRYTRIESPFPVQSYLGTVEVRKVNDDSSEVSWTVEFDVQEEQRDAMIEFLHTVLAQGIQGLEQDLLQPQLV